MINGQKRLVGVVTRRDLLGAGSPEAAVGAMVRRPPVVVYDDCTLREAADHMVRHDVGRLPVLRREAGPKGGNGELAGIITRSDVLKAHLRRMRETQEPAAPTVSLPFRKLGGWHTEPAKRHGS